MSNLAPGTIVDGRFEVIGEIGAGGMGVVYRARHIAMQRDVAMKVLRAGLSTDSDKLQRFRREAQVVSVLEHPNIVQIYAIGMMTDGLPYIAMEYLPGEQLSESIARTGPIPWRKALGLFTQICGALEYAHGMEIIHRDIKPSNIVLSKDENGSEKFSVKLVDFGIAKSLAEGAPQLTRTEMVMGSVFYLSPGQFQGRAADVRSDIYSLGCTFFEVLTGVPPFQGDSMFETVTKQCNDAPPMVNAINPDAQIPDDMEYLLQWMLRKETDERPQSVSEVREALLRIGAGVPLERKEQPATKPGASPGKKPGKKLKTKAVLWTAIAVVTLLVSLAVPNLLKPAQPPAVQYEPELAAMMEKIESRRGESQFFEALPDLAVYYSNEPLKAQMVCEKALALAEKQQCSDHAKATLYGYLGDRYQNTGRFDDSIDCFRKSIDLIRSYSTAHLQNFDLLLIFAQLRRWKDAQEVAPALLKEAEIRVLLEEAPHLYRAAARTYLSTDKFSDAKNVIKLIPKVGNDPRELERAVYTVELEDAIEKRAPDSKLLALEKQIFRQDGSINKVEMLVSLSRIYRRHNDSKQSARLSFAAGDVLFSNDIGPPPERVRAGTFALAVFEEALLHAGKQERPAIEKKIESLRKEVQVLYQKANDRTGITIPSF